MDLEAVDGDGNSVQRSQSRVHSASSKGAAIEPMDLGVDVGAYHLAVAIIKPIVWLLFFYFDRLYHFGYSELVHVE